MEETKDNRNEVDKNEVDKNEKLIEKAKGLKNIVYSLDSVKDNHKINFYYLKDEKNQIDKGAFILKYKYKGIDQEVIIATMDKAGNHIENAKNIIELIESQLEANFKGKTDYKKFEQLRNYINKSQSPFSFTMEGSDIYFCAKEGDNVFKRTYYERINKFKKNTIECLYTDDEMKRMKKERQDRTQQLVNKIEKNTKWKKRRELILQKLPTEEEKIQFLQGEKISEIFQENEECIITNRRDVVADYLIENYENANDENSDGFKDLEKYLEIKEKGLSIDAKIILERIQNKYFENIQEKGGEISPKDERTMNTLDNYKSFFELIKTGRDFNARFLALKWKKIDFGIVNKFFELYSQKDVELLNYLQLKEDVINDIQIQEKVGLDDYKKHESIRNLYNFLAHSHLRNYTKDDDKEFMLDTYDKMREEVVNNNIESVEKYNYYAEKNGLFICPVDSKKRNKEIQNESTTVKRLYEVDSNKLETDDIIK